MQFSCSPVASLGSHIVCCSPLPGAKASVAVIHPLILDFEDLSISYTIVTTDWIPIMIYSIVWIVALVVAVNGYCSPCKLRTTLNRRDWHLGNTKPYQLARFFPIFHILCIDSVEIENAGAKRGMPVSVTGKTVDAKKKAQALDKQADLAGTPPTPLVVAGTEAKSNNVGSKEQLARLEALSGVVHQIERSYGKGSIQKLGETSTVNVETFSSGSVTLDMAMGGGYPRGRVIEIYGPESSGKTTLALHAVAEMQRQGGE